MLELEDDFVTYKFQKPLTFRSWVLKNIIGNPVKPVIYWYQLLLL